MTAGRLDLCAVEAEARRDRTMLSEDVLVLLAHCRAVRAALQAVLSEFDDAREHAVEVLETAGDAAGAAPEETGT